MVGKTREIIKKIYCFLNRENAQDYIIVFHYDKPWNKVVLIHLFESGASEIKYGKIWDDNNRSYIAKMMSELSPAGFREVSYKDLMMYPSIKERVDELIKEFNGEI